MNKCAESDRTRRYASTLLLLGIHGCVVVGSPFVAGLVFQLKASGVVGLLSAEDLRVFGLVLVLAYLFFGIPTVGAVLLASPLAWMFSKVRERVLASLMAALTCGGIGWTVCMVITYAESEELISAIRIGAAVAGAVGGVVLEAGWRIYTHSRTSRNVGNECRSGATC